MALLHVNITDPHVASEAFARQTLDIEPMLVQCESSAADSETLFQFWGKSAY